MRHRCTGSLLLGCPWRASVLFEAVNDHLGAKPFASFHKLQVLPIIAMSNIRAAMPVEGRKAAYFVGKAAFQLPPGYITEEFLRKLAAATGCDTPFWVEDFIQKERDQEQYFRTHKK
jgi:hypothetical protein